MHTKNTFLFLIVVFTVHACTASSPDSTELTASDAPESVPDDSLINPEIIYATPLIEKISLPKFTLYGELPVLEKTQNWEPAIIWPGAIIYHEGLFHMLYQGFDVQNFESPLESIGYAVSVDGYQWVRAMDEPITFSEKQEFDLPYLLVSSLLVDQDGTWIMYFTGGAKIGISAPFIGRATAPDIAGPWKIDANPMLLPGNPARWDNGGLSKPQVFKTPGGYMMFFDGTHLDASLYGPTQIGMATSKDGINWTKFDDPETTGRRYEDSDPVFKVAEEFAWDSSGLHIESILQTQEGWAMLYYGSLKKELNSITNLGFATSADGITWDRHESNPIMVLEDFMLGYRIGSLVWFIHQDVQLLLFGASHESLDTTEIYLATSN